MSDEETYTLGDVEGRVSPPADPSLSSLIHIEVCPWSWRLPAALALCWRGKWPWGKRPTLEAYGYDVQAFGRDAQRQLLAGGVYADDYTPAAVAAFQASKAGVLRPSEVAAKADFSDEPSQDGGEPTS